MIPGGSAMASIKWVQKGGARAGTSGFPMRKRKELSEEQIGEIKDAFAIFDTNKTGINSVQRLIRCRRTHRGEGI